MQQAGQFDADASGLAKPDTCIDPRHLEIHSSGTAPQYYQQHPSALLAMLETLGSKDPYAFHTLLEALRSKFADGLPPTDRINPGPVQRSGFNDDFAHRGASSAISHQGGATHPPPYQPSFTLFGNSGELPVGESSAGTMG